MSQAADLTQLLADLNDLATAAQSLGNQILNTLLSNAREEIRKSLALQGEQATSPNAEESLPLP